MPDEPKLKIAESDKPKTKRVDVEITEAVGNAFEEIFRWFMEAMPEIIVDPALPEATLVNEEYAGLPHGYIRDSFANFLEQAVPEKIEVEVLDQ